MPYSVSLRSPMLAGAGFALICGGVFLLLKAGVPLSELSDVDLPIAALGAFVSVLGGICLYASGDGLASRPLHP